MSHGKGLVQSIMKSTSLEKALVLPEVKENVQAASSSRSEVYLCPDSKLHRTLAALWCWHIYYLSKRHASSIIIILLWVSDVVLR